MQKLIWTVLPQGMNTEDGTLHFSLMISPRLDLGPGGTLGDTVMADWPEVVPDLSLSLSFDGGGAMEVHFDRDLPNLDRWQEIFSYDTLLKPYTFSDHSTRPLHSFSATRLHARFDTLYRTVAAESPTEYPSLVNGVVGELVQAVGRVKKALMKARRENFPLDGQRSRLFPHGTTEEDFIEEYYETLVDGDPAGSACLAADLYRLRSFYQRLGDKWSQADENNNPDHKRGELREVLDLSPPGFDFHEVVALFGDYPELLRQLGLLIPCWIKFNPATIPNGSTYHTVQAVVENWDGAVENRCPKTAYELHPGEGILQPASQSAVHIKDGLLRLNNTKRYQVIQTDVDGTGSKLIQFGLNMFKRLDEINPNRKKPRPEHDSLPSRRNSGFSIIERNRKHSLASRLEVSRDLNDNVDSPDSILLFAQDLLRGYRLDVEYHDQWHSLCRRRGTIQVEGSVLDPIKEDDKEGYVKSSGVTSSALESSTPKHMYLHEGMLGWDGWSLCVLRPGRALVNEDTVDGNEDRIEWVKNDPYTPYGVHTDFKVVPRSLPPLRFGERYRFRARTVDLSGHSLPRTNPNEEGATAPVRYFRYEPVETPALVPRVRYTEGESLEHMVIRSDLGVSAEQYAEAVDSGLEGEYEFFPRNDRHVASPKVSQLLCEHNGDFDGAFGLGGDIEGFRELARQETGTFMDEIGDVELCGPPGTVPPPISGYERGDGLGEGQYVIHKEKQILIPYLADFLAQGFVLRDAETKNEIFHHKWDLSSWPEMYGFRVVIGETDAPDTVVTVGDDHVLIGLPKAKKLQVLFSSFLNDTSLKKLGMFWDGRQQLIDSGAGSSEVAEWRKQALQGENWLLTPYKTLTLVHAVQRPIEIPVFVNLRSIRNPDDTHADLHFHLDVHGWSTGKMEPQATWEEYLDLVDEDIWRIEDKAGSAEEQPVKYDDELITRCIRKHEFGDTKHRMVTYTPVGTTRYLEYFPAEIIANKEKIILRGDEVTISVPSTARPATPKVPYLIPTFRWERPSKDTSVRRGRSVRIYLERPWFSSGQDEKLAVLLQPSKRGIGIIGLGPNQYNFVSHWGRDPLWYGDVAPLNPSAFENAEEQVDDLQLAELPDGVLVNAMVFTPLFNEDRKMWYVDIDMDPGDEAYYPFVSFALARYQGESLADLELSRVVRAECIQLTADRTATVTRHFENLLSVQVFGPSGMAQRVPVNGESPEHTVRACIQETTGDPKQDLGWEALTDYVELSPSTSEHQTTWTGRLPVPDLSKDSNYRVLIEELETYKTDPRVSETIVRSRRGQRINLVGERSRIVYVDTFPLPQR
ncbi:MAG: hypothetical protein GY854_04675 [Deltaproteobacteria bacterium]|nr:hypothetical protein [Deltaproteobacteria bacterium]